eukprot:CAMPEP_0172312186 /NCGR_PEP_ID=MMETSP1058-20130122/17003_1 /TAXON_ID=83371 /ORGANISM="Detonula confervacea, Strain CCMP 353" /LENGTH=36 /DNA_ID= /DNA_START= /DNA_END= /DNA_ORIENTATION=
MEDAKAHLMDALRILRSGNDGSGGETSAADYLLLPE